MGVNNSLSADSRLQNKFLLSMSSKDFKKTQDRAWNFGLESKHTNAIQKVVNNFSIKQPFTKDKLFGLFIEDVTADTKNKIMLALIKKLASIWYGKGKEKDEKLKENIIPAILEEAKNNKIQDFILPPSLVDSNKFVNDLVIKDILDNDGAVFGGCRDISYRNFEDFKKGAFDEYKKSLIDKIIKDEDVYKAWNKMLGKEEMMDILQEGFNKLKQIDDKSTYVINLAKVMAGAKALNWQESFKIMQDKLGDNLALRGDFLESFFEIVENDSWQDDIYPSEIEALIDNVFDLFVDEDNYEINWNLLDRISQKSEYARQVIARKLKDKLANWILNEQKLPENNSRSEKELLSFMKMCGANSMALGGIWQDFVKNIEEYIDLGKFRSTIDEYIVNEKMDMDYGIFLIRMIEKMLFEKQNKIPVGIKKFLDKQKISNDDIKLQNIYNDAQKADSDNEKRNVLFLLQKNSNKYLILCQKKIDELHERASRAKAKIRKNELESEKKNFIDLKAFLGSLKEENISKKSANELNEYIQSVINLIDKELIEEDKDTPLLKESYIDDFDIHLKTEWKSFGKGKNIYNSRVDFFKPVISELEITQNILKQKLNNFREKEKKFKKGISKIDKNNIEILEVNIQKFEKQLVDIRKLLKMSKNEFMQAIGDMKIDPQVKELVNDYLWQKQLVMKNFKDLDEDVKINSLRLAYEASDKRKAFNSFILIYVGWKESKRSLKEEIDVLEKILKKKNNDIRKLRRRMPDYVQTKAQVEDYLILLKEVKKDFEVKIEEYKSLLDELAKGLGKDVKDKIEKLKIDDEVNTFIDSLQNEDDEVKKKVLQDILDGIQQTSQNLELGYEIDDGMVEYVADLIKQEDPDNPEDILDQLFEVAQKDSYVMDKYLMAVKIALKKGIKDENMNLLENSIKNLESFDSHQNILADIYGLLAKRFEQQGNDQKALKYRTEQKEALEALKKMEKNDDTGKNQSSLKKDVLFNRVQALRFFYRKSQKKEELEIEGLYNLLNRPEKAISKAELIRCNNILENLTKNIDEAKQAKFKKQLRNELSNIRNLKNVFPEQQGGFDIEDLMTQHVEKLTQATADRCRALLEIKNGINSFLSENNLHEGIYAIGDFGLRIEFFWKNIQELAVKYFGYRKGDDLSAVLTNGVLKIQKKALKEIETYEDRLNVFKLNLDAMRNRYLERRNKVRDIIAVKGTQNMEVEGLIREGLLVLKTLFRSHQGQRKNSGLVDKTHFRNSLERDFRLLDDEAKIRVLSDIWEMANAFPTGEESSFLADFKKYQKELRIFCSKQAMALMARVYYPQKIVGGGEPELPNILNGKVDLDEKSGTARLLDRKLLLYMPDSLKELVMKRIVRNAFGGMLESRVLKKEYQEFYEAISHDLDKDKKLVLDGDVKHVSVDNLRMMLAMARGLLFAEKNNQCVLNNNEKSEWLKIRFILENDLQTIDEVEAGHNAFIQALDQCRQIVENDGELPSEDSLQNKPLSMAQQANAVSWQDVAILEPKGLKIAQFEELKKNLFTSKENIDTQDDMPNLFEEAKNFVAQIVNLILKDTSQENEAQEDELQNMSQEELNKFIQENLDVLISKQSFIKFSVESLVKLDRFSNKENYIIAPIVEYLNLSERIGRLDFRQKQENSDENKDELMNDEVKVDDAQEDMEDKNSILMQEKVELEKRRKALLEKIQAKIQKWIEILKESSSD